MSDLLLMSSLGLPRNGLVLLADPYRDVYGRNVLPVGAEVPQKSTTLGWDVFTCTPAVAGPDADGWYTVTFATGGGYYRFFVTGVAAGAVTRSAIEAYIVSGTAGYGKLASAASVPSDPSVLTISNATYETLHNAIFGFYNMSDGAVIKLRNPQINLGPVLHAYSAPSGEPGTLQTSLDYSGNGNHLTLGATTGASTDDPAFTGTAWSFDGGDFLLTPLKTTFPCTFLAVVKPTNVDRAIWGSSAANGLVLRLTADNKLQLARDGSSSYTAGSTAIDPTKANICLASLSVSGGIAYYVNGVAETTTTADAGNLNQTLTHWVAKRYSGAFLSGEIFALAKWSRALAPNEAIRVTRHYQSLLSARGVTVA